MTTPAPSRRDRRERRRRTTWIVIAAIVVVVAVVAGIVALTSGGDGNDEQASTTRDTTASTTETTGGGSSTTPKTDATPSTTAGRPGGPCKAADFTANPGSSTVRGPNQVVVVILDNTGGRQCTMNGYPGVEALGSDGKPVGATVAQGGDGIPAELTPQAVTVDPGGKASFVMAWNPVTGTCLDVRSFDITLPGDSKTIPFKSSVNVCDGGIRVSAIQSGVASA